jgi:hypothetical protein
MATGRIGSTPTLRTRWSKLPTTGTTVLSGLDDNSVALVYDAGYEAVYRNGVLLSRGNDYTATDGTTVTLVDATLAGDVIEIFANDLVPLTDAISKGQYNAKGALLSATAASTPAVLAVGSNTQVLTADSTTSTGLKWATPVSGGTGGYTLLNAGGTALSGSSTVTVSSITSNDLLIYVTGAATAGTNVSMSYKFNSSATNHNAAGLRIIGASGYAASNFDQIQEANSGIIPFSYTSSSASRPSRGYLMVQACTSSTVKPLWFAAANDGGGGSGQWSYSGGGYFDAAAAITSVSLVIGSGTFNAGTLFVYGRS